VNSLTASDFDPLFIEDAQTVVDPAWPMTFVVHDILDGPLEHTSHEDEGQFLTNICNSIEESGIPTFGMPSIESQE
jgi:hypothetical protein